MLQRKQSKKAPATSLARPLQLCDLVGTNLRCDQIQPGRESVAGPCELHFDNRCGLFVVAAAEFLANNGSRTLRKD